MIWSLMQVINPVLEPPDFTIALCVRHTWDFPELNRGLGYMQNSRDQFWSCCQTVLRGMKAVGYSLGG